MRPARATVLAAAAAALVASGCGSSSDDTTTGATKAGQGRYILGAWTGVLHQKGMPDFRVAARIGSLSDPKRNTVSYTGIDCGGNWTYLGFSAGSYRFREVISRGKGGSCKGTGRVKLAPHGPDSVDYSFRGGGVVSLGTLARRS